MGKMPDLDWTQHKKIDYTQNLRKTPVKAKIRPSQCFYMGTASACLFHSATELGICNNFMEFGQNYNFLGNFGNCHFRNDKNCMNLC